jgi:methoxymalonate biosynthesis acyl carrier protein
MNIEDRVAGFFASTLRQQIDAEADVFDLGLVDSLFAMQLVDFVEKEFSLTVERTELDIDNFRSVRALTDFIHRKQTAGPG